MSSKENNEVAVEKLDNEKSAEAKCELKGTKRAAEVSFNDYTFIIIFKRPFWLVCNSYGFETLMCCVYRFTVSFNCA